MDNEDRRAEFLAALVTGEVVLCRWCRGSGHSLTSTVIKVSFLLPPCGTNKILVISNPLFFPNPIDDHPKQITLPLRFVIRAISFLQSAQYFIEENSFFPYILACVIEYGGSYKTPSYSRRCNVFRKVRASKWCFAGVSGLMSF